MIVLIGLTHIIVIVVYTLASFQFQFISANFINL